MGNRGLKMDEDGHNFTRIFRLPPNFKKKSAQQLTSNGRQMVDWGNSTNFTSTAHIKINCWITAVDCPVIRGEDCK